MTLRIFFSFFLIFYSLTTQRASPAIPKPWALNHESIEQSLLNDKILKLTPMKEFLKTQGKLADFTNDVYLAELEHGLKAVFKSDPEERDMYGEVAAYKASKLTGVDCVPPTVIRKHGKMKGSLQYYVETQVNGTSSSEIFEKCYALVPDVERSDAEAFAFIFGQWDKSYGNFLFISSLNPNALGLILIDNAGISQLQHVRIGESPFVRRAYSDKRRDKWATHFPFDQMCEIPYSEISQHKDIKDFDLGPNPFQFLKKDNKPLRYILWNNSLWFQAHSDRPFIPKQISQTFFTKLMSLTEKDIKIIWKQTPRSWNTSLKKCILLLILERRDQLVNYIQIKNIAIIKNY